MYLLYIEDDHEDDEQRTDKTLAEEESAKMSSEDNDSEVCVFYCFSCSVNTYRQSPLPWKVFVSLDMDHSISF